MDVLAAAQGEAEAAFGAAEGVIIGWPVGKPLGWLFGDFAAGVAGGT